MLFFESKARREEKLMRHLMFADLNWLVTMKKENINPERALVEIESGQLSDETRRALRILKENDNKWAKFVDDKTKDEFGNVIGGRMIATAIPVAASDRFTSIPIPEEKKHGGVGMNDDIICIELETNEDYGLYTMHMTEFQQDFNARLKRDKICVKADKIGGLKRRLAEIGIRISEE